MGRDIADFRSVCGRTLAIVLASGPEAIEQVQVGQGEEGDALVCAVVDSACWAQMAFVFVLAPPRLGETVTRLVHLAKRRKNAPIVQVVECEEEALSATRDASNLDVAHALVEASPVDCDAAMVIDAIKPLVTADEIYELCNRACDEPGADLRMASGGSRYLVSFKS